MKTFWLVCAGMADEPLESLGGRTPLEVAKTPSMDALAKKSVLANAAWLDASLPADSEVAALSMLGYNPKETYSGIAPLDAVAAGLSQNDAQIVFRADFVTVADGELTDHAAGSISSKEAQVLVMELNRALSSMHAKLVNVDGYKNLLIVDDAQLASELDSVECTAPSRRYRQVLSKTAPKGRGGEILRKMTNLTCEVLENHDVNRVRIDLGENPASQIWLWGQGRRPKLSSFEERTKTKGAFFADNLSWKGLSLAAGMRTMKKWDENEFADFNLFESSANFPENSKDYKAKVRRIEEFDTKVVGKLMAWLEKKKTPARIVITSDVVHSAVQGVNTHGHAPVLFWEEGASVQGADAFHEKNCGLSGRLYDPGHAFIAQILKGA